MSQPNAVLQTLCLHIPTQRLSFMRNPATMCACEDVRKCAFSKIVPGCSSTIVGVCTVIYYSVRCVHACKHAAHGTHTWHHHQLPPIFLRLVHKLQSDLGNCTRLSNYLSSVLCCVCLWMDGNEWHSNTVRLFFHSFIKKLCVIQQYHFIHS